MRCYTCNFIIFSFSMRKNSINAYNISLSFCMSRLGRYYILLSFCMGTECRAFLYVIGIAFGMGVRCPDYVLSSLRMGIRCCGKILFPLDMGIVASCYREPMPVLRLSVIAVPCILQCIYRSCIAWR